MSERKVDKFFDNKSYLYDKKITPIENYQYFLQSISLARGIEFVVVEDKNKREYVLYLYDIPGLTCNFKIAKEEHELFHAQLIDHIHEIINTNNDAYVIYSSVYDLFKEVQSDLNTPSPESFFAIKTILHNSETVAERRKKRIPLIAGTRKGALIQQTDKGFNQVQFEDLSAAQKNFIIRLIKLRRRYKRRLFTELKELLTLLFNNKAKLKHYQYNGDIVDIIEVAILLFEKIESFGSNNLSLEQFSKDLAALLGRPFSRLSDQKDTLAARAKDPKMLSWKNVTAHRERIMKLINPE